MANVNAHLRVAAAPFGGGVAPSGARGAPEGVVSGCGGSAEELLRAAAGVDRHDGLDAALVLAVHADVVTPRADTGFLRALAEDVAIHDDGPPRRRVEGEDPLARVRSRDLQPADLVCRLDGTRGRGTTRRRGGRLGGGELRRRRV